MNKSVIPMDITKQNRSSFALYLRKTNRLSRTLNCYFSTKTLEHTRTMHVAQIAMCGAVHAFDELGGLFNSQTHTEKTCECLHSVCYCRKHLTDTKKEK